MADINVLFKNAVKEIAAAHGRSATFMAKPHFDDAGSSCHIHSSLWYADGATSADGRRRRAPHERRVPLVPRRAAGDRRASSPLLFAPTVNSYKRFQPGSWAPTGDRLGHRQPHARVPRRRPRRGAAGREPHPGRRRQHLPRLRGDDRRRAARHRQPHRAAARRTTATATRRPTCRGSRRRSSRRSSCGAAATSPGSASATTSTTTCCTSPSPSGRRSTAPSPTGSGAATSSGSGPARSPSRCACRRRRPPGGGGSPSSA